MVYDNTEISRVFQFTKTMEACLVVKGGEKLLSILNKTLKACRLACFTSALAIYGDSTADKQHFWTL